MSSRVVPDVPSQAVLEQCVRAGIRAPSVYNSQPWLFRLRAGGVEVLADPVRRVPAVDPDGREMHISLGAAVCNVAVTLTANGYAVAVELLPTPDEPRLVARVQGCGMHQVDLHEVALALAVTRRHTVRTPFHERPLHGSLEESLSRAASREGATLQLLDAPDARALLALVRSADSQLRRDPAYGIELAQWTSGRADRRDGVLPQAYGSPSADGALPLRDFGAYQPWSRQPPARYETSPNIAVLSTPADEPRDWLRAGMALERVLLEATLAGVSASFLTQPLEVPHLRRLYDDRWPHQATQMIFRLGYPREASRPLSPRQSLAAVLIQDQ